MTATDACIQHLSDDNLLLRERIASLEADVVAYHELSQLALAALHHLTAKQDRLVRRLQFFLNPAIREETGHPPIVPAVVPHVDLPACLVRASEIRWKDS